MFNKKDKKEEQQFNLNGSGSTFNGTEIFLEPDLDVMSSSKPNTGRKVESKKNNSSKSSTKTKKSNTGGRQVKQEKQVVDFKSMPRSEVDPELLSISQKCEYFNPAVTQQRFTIYVILGVIACIGLGFAYQLNWILTLLETIVGFFVVRKIILHSCRARYEEDKVEDVGTYVEQMLYSFRRNGKILTSLQDAATVFPPCEMKECIDKAIKHITDVQSVGNIYEEALMIIQDRFDCRRIRSLHRYLVKVEGIGGENEIGVQALLSDRRLWLARIDDFKKEKKTTQFDIIVACAFSSAICAATMYMLPSYVGAAKHIIARAFSTIYILINFWTISGTMKGTIYHLNDLYTQEEEEYLLKKFRWIKSWDKKTEQKKAMKPAIMMSLVGVVALFLGYWWMTLICLALAAFLWLLQPMLRHNSSIKSITKEIEKAYPDWLLELSLLLQTDNLHVALEKTMDTAPLLLKDDLILLGDEIAANPTDVEPFNNFLGNLKLPSIHSSMRLLFSIANYGSDDETRQIAELIERNALLMNKAEEQKNSDRLAKITIFKFMPMGASALKLIVDMAVFLIVFISQSLGSMTF
jgi:ABC-type multidrug transport system fused ATPase/permease subunit